MAKAITHIEKTVPDPIAEQALAADELLATAAKHKDALMKFMSILQGLNEFGMLDMADAFIKNRHDIGVIGITQVNKPGFQHLLKNGMTFLQVMGEIDSAKSKATFDAFAAGVNEVASRQNRREKPLGVFEVFRLMRDPSINASLQAGLHFLEGMGRSIQEDSRTLPKEGSGIDANTNLPH